MVQIFFIDFNIMMTFKFLFNFKVGKNNPLSNFVRLDLVFVAVQLEFVFCIK